MDEKKAKELLAPAIQTDGWLFNLGWYLNWKLGDKDATLDGSFTADDLEAIAWWMRNAK